MCLQSLDICLWPITFRVWRTSSPPPKPDLAAVRKPNQSRAGVATIVGSERPRCSRRCSRCRSRSRAGTEPEVAAVLAVAATALLAGERWAIAVVAVAELLLAPSVAAHAFLGGLALWPGRIASLAALIAIVPGLLALRRAAATLVIVTGRERSRAMCRRFHIGLVIVGVLAMLVPLL